MSIIQLRSRIFSSGPRVWGEGTRLHIRTNLLVRLFTLFAHVRTVIVDTKRKRVEARSRWLWLWQRERHIPFERIAYLDYSYTDWVTSCTSTLDTANRYEIFTIALALDDDSRVTVCRYRGEGSAMTGWYGVLAGDSVLDTAGVQEEASRNLVEVLLQLLDVPLGQRLLSRDAKGIAVCDQCNRHLTAGEAICPMCGGGRKVVG